jgi:hypothetical protein
MAYALRSPRWKCNYEQVSSSFVTFLTVLHVWEVLYSCIWTRMLMDGIKFVNLRQETVDERDSVAHHDKGKS